MSSGIQPLTADAVEVCAPLLLVHARGERRQPQPLPLDAGRSDCSVPAGGGVMRLVLGIVRRPHTFGKSISDE